MAVTYKYKAIDANGRFRNDRIDADNVLDLEQRLGGMGLELINYKEYKAGLFSLRSRKIARKELINFTFQMQQLTKSGVTILDALDDLKESSAQGHTREILSGMIDEIEGGKTFSEALQEFPDSFDEVYITLVKVGEESGRISEVLDDLAENLKWQDELISHTKRIMIYPTIVTLVVIGVVTFLMLFLIPQLIPFIQEIGGVIPLHTRALIATSTIMGNYWYLIFGIPFFSIVALKAWASKNEKVRYKLDQFKLRLYIFGPLILKTNLARLANYFSMMYSSGLTVLDALKISERLVNNTVLSKSVVEAREHIEDGELISESFKQVDMYPPLVIRMLKVGENTGALDEALNNVSYFYNREVRETVDKMEAAITPVITVVLGGVMLWIMSAVLGPIYDSLAKMNF